MKNKFKAFQRIMGIIVLSVIIGFSITACGGEEKTGKLTITNLTDHDGNFIIALGNFEQGDSLFAGAGFDAGTYNGTGTRISGSSTTLDVWKVAFENGEPDSKESFNESGEAYFDIAILNKASFVGDDIGDMFDYLYGFNSKPSWLVDYGWIELTFNDGVGTGEFESYTY
ncbi:MAG: hypothetical protein LBC80_03285 [Treponema sp.]|jgi:hypothetical protein|nr:hypothetical protein [Treponema sp.]